MTAALRGLAWDHRRCWGPLDASVAPYAAAHPELSISWDRRSLHEFGEGRLESVVRNYDLLVFDHPFVGEVARDRVLVAFDAYLSADDRERFAADSVGASWRSYQYGGSQWALPIDAAAQVSAYRPDLLEPFADRVPTTYSEVVQLGGRLRSAGKWLGLPWIPTDAMCLMLSFAAGAGDAIGAAGRFLPRDVVGRIVGELRELVALAHPSSKSWNPIRCYDHMLSHDDVAYVPYAFGYVNYASGCTPPHLRFANVPVHNCAGALLGGAGIGVSAYSAHRQAACDYALFLCSADYQRGDYARFGGQPGSLGAWTDPTLNAQARNFYADTLSTLSNAYLRPTHPGFMAFFRDGAVAVVRAINAALPIDELTDYLDRRYFETLPTQTSGPGLR